LIKMATVEQALALLREYGAKRLLPVETVGLQQAAGRRLAQPVKAGIFQPPADVSSMDGYAVRFPDMRPGARLKVVGESRAGAPFEGPVGYREAVRIFTGAFIPEGASHVLIQEDTKRDGDTVEVTHDQPRAENIRRKGRDFSAGQVLVPAGQALTPGALALAAAGNAAELRVRRQPLVALLANGDELVEPGEDLRPGQVTNSIAPALDSLIRRWGGQVNRLGVAQDNEADVRNRIGGPADLIVSIGGASVGDYDVVRPAFAAAGFEPVFEKIAVKPGKPTWFSAAPTRLALGLPGNPAAAMVTAQIFLKPLLDALSGSPEAKAPVQRAHLARPLAAAGGREEYLRAILTLGADGKAQAAPAEDQDSSLLHPFLAANALIRRPAHSAAAMEGDLVEVMTLA
jgi:molybdopterin molybdotransferase